MGASFDQAAPPELLLPPTPSLRRDLTPNAPTNHPPKQTAGRAQANTGNKYINPFYGT